MKKEVALKRDTDIYLDTEGWYAGMASCGLIIRGSYDHSMRCCLIVTKLLITDILMILTNVVLLYR